MTRRDFLTSSHLKLLLHGKTSSEIAESVAHAPARAAIIDAGAKGVSDEILKSAWDNHVERCRRRGIPV